MFPMGLLISIGSMLAGLYAYQYFMKPTVDMESFDAYRSKSTKRDNKNGA